MCYIISVNLKLFNFGGNFVEKLVVTGGTPLRGEAYIGGAKNAAVAILPAALLIDGVCTIDNIPNISDVRLYIDILRSFGAKAEWTGPHELTLDTTNVCASDKSLELTRKFRASYYALGSLLGRCKMAQVGIPGRL